MIITKEYIAKACTRGNSVDDSENTGYIDDYDDVGFGTNKCIESPSLGVADCMENIRHSPDWEVTICKTDYVDWDALRACYYTPEILEAYKELICLTIPGMREKLEQGLGEVSYERVWLHFPEGHSHVRYAQLLVTRDLWRNPPDVLKAVYQYQHGLDPFEVMIYMISDCGFRIHNRNVVKAFKQIERWDTATRGFSEAWRKYEQRFECPSDHALDIEAGHDCIIGNVILNCLAYDDVLGIASIYKLILDKGLTWVPTVDYTPNAPTISLCCNDCRRSSEEYLELWLKENHPSTKRFVERRDIVKEVRRYAEEANAKR